MHKYVDVPNKKKTKFLFLEMYNFCCNVKGYGAGYTCP